MGRTLTSATAALLLADVGAHGPAVAAQPLAVLVQPPGQRRLVQEHPQPPTHRPQDRKSTRLNSSHANISYAVFCLKKKQQLNQKLDVPDADGAVNMVRVLV